MPQNHYGSQHARIIPLRWVANEWMIEINGSMLHFVREIVALEVWSFSSSVWRSHDWHRGILEATSAFSSILVL